MRLARVPVAFVNFEMLLSGLFNARSDFWMQQEIVDILVVSREKRAYIYFRIPDFYQNAANPVEDPYRPEDEVFERRSDMTKTGGEADEWLMFRPEITKEMIEQRNRGENRYGRQQ